MPAANIRAGAWTLLMRDMSASLVIRENADPAVLRDLQRSKQRLAPGDLDYEHDTEGPDDMPAHVRSALTSATLTIPVLAATLSLGTWQARCL